MNAFTYCKASINNKESLLLCTSFKGLDMGESSLCFSEYISSVNLLACFGASYIKTWWTRYTDHFLQEHLCLT